MMAPNGTRFGGWLLNTADNQLGIAGKYAGGRQAEILVSSPWGIGILQLSGSHVNRADDAAQRHALRWLASEHRRQRVLRARFGQSRSRSLEAFIKRCSRTAHRHV